MHVIVELWEAANAGFQTVCNLPKCLVSMVHSVVALENVWICSRARA